MAARDTNAPEEERISEERRLQGYFTGRRQALRTCKFIDCRLTGNHDGFNAMIVDVSRTGALVRVLDSHFAESHEAEQLMLYTARVWYHFDEGLEISFLDGKVKAVADVVRVTGYCGRGSGLNLIGIHFREELTADECEQIGIEASDDRPSMGPLAEEARAKMASA
ncbi:MAG: PilZ domain-containing protein [Planctomycetota bacterium]